MVQCRHLGCSLGTAGGGVNGFMKCVPRMVGRCCDSGGRGGLLPLLRLTAASNTTGGRTLVVEKNAQ